MAHMIDSITWAGETPWHGLGHRIPANVTGQEMLRLANLDWTVEGVPCWADLRTLGRTGTDRASRADRHKALVRSDTGTVLAIVGRDYGILQNADLFALTDAAVGTGSAVYHVAGALDEGRRVWALCEMPQDEREVAGEVVKPYLLGLAGHDGSTSERLRFSMTRVVCQNTLTVALGEHVPHEIVIRHTSNAKARHDQAVAIVEQARAYFGAFHQRALNLASQRLALGTAIELSAKLFPNYKNAKGENVTPEAQGKVVSLFRHQEDSSDHRIAGTKWGFFNAVTALLDHNVRSVRKDARLNRFVTGQQDAVRTQAMDLLLAA